MESRLSELLEMLRLKWGPDDVRRFIAPYRLGPLLADGRVAIVFAASGPGTRRRDKVLKFPGPQGLYGGKPYNFDIRVETLREEARVLNVCRGVPNLVRIIEDCTDRPLPFLVMELLGSGSLEDMLKVNRTLKFPAWLKLLVDLSAGLEGMHAIGECHNDVKPANVLLGPKQARTLIDPCMEDIRTDAYYDEDDDVSNGPARDMVALGATMREALLGLKSHEPDWVMFRQLEPYPELVSLMRRLRRDGRCKLQTARTVWRSATRVMTTRIEAVP